MRAWLVVVAAAAMLTASCKKPLEYDSSGAQFIPTDLAVGELKELLPTSVSVRCSEPKVTAVTSKVTGWVVEADHLEFEVEEQGRCRLEFADITKLGLNRLNIFYEVRVHTTYEAREWKEHFRFSWKEEAPARRAVELLEALRAGAGEKKK